MDSHSHKDDEEAQPPTPDADMLFYDKPSHSEILKLLLEYDLTNSWNVIGTLLGFPLEKIHAIEKHSKNEMQCLQEITGAWVCQSVKTCNWKRLISAVKYVDKYAAIVIEQKHVIH